MSAPAPMLPLQRYSQMCRAIEAAHAVDEVKGIRDKALALEHYAKAKPSFLYVRELLPAVSGVYVFEAYGRVLYVGESRNLQKRLSNHPRGHLYEIPCSILKLIPCCNHKQVERWLIEALRPELNRLPVHWQSRHDGGGEDWWITWERLFGPLPKGRES
jgi:hypothetical protein